MEKHDVERALDKLFSAPKHSVDLGDFAQAIVAAFDGPEGLAREAKSLYDTTESVQQRNAVLKMLLGIVRDHASLNKGEQSREAGMSDEEIRDEIKAMLSDAATPTEN